MGRFGYEVIDADGHVTEAVDEFKGYLDQPYRDRLQRILDWSARTKSVGHMAASGGIPYNYMAQGFERTGRRFLGTWDVGESLDPEHTVIGRTGGLAPNTRKGGGRDPSVTREDITDLGIDRAVWFPSSATSFIAVGDPGFEAALCTAYNRWIDGFCRSFPGDYYGVAVIPHLDMKLASEEINRVGKEAWCLGVATCAVVDERLGDHPSFHPMYQAAQENDLALCVHSGTDRPPYAPGRSELSDNYFLLHMTGHPWQQMRAMAALIGGGIFEEFPRLQVVHLESGCGWVPYWMERMDHHFETLGYTVPKLTLKPSEVVTGGRLFASFEVDEEILPEVAQIIGDGQLVFASDYPHFDANYEGIKDLTERQDITDAQKAMFLGENARRLYPRLN